jgi:hypothetical protein
LQETSLLHAALELQNFFEEHHWKYAFIGGLANLRWGQPRTTEDIDSTLLTSFVGEENVIDTILAKFPARISDAKKFAKAHRVLLLTTSNGVGADVSLGGIPFEEQLVNRATLFEYSNGFTLRTCSAEDLVILKAFAARDKDWLDIRQILAKQTGCLDLEYIRRHLQPLVELKEEPEIMMRLENMVAQTSEPLS